MITGTCANLGKVYQQDMPTFGGRGWRLTIPGLPTNGPFGPQELVYNDEYLATEIGQVGFVCRGVLLDATGSPGNPIALY